MKVREICEKVRSGEITLDYAGHRVGIDKEELLKRFDDNVNLGNGSNDGKWQSIEKPDDKDKRTPEEINASMRDFYNRHLDFEIEQEDTLRWGGLHDHRVCYNCGQYLHWTLTGEKLRLRNHYEEDPKHKRGYDWVNHPADYVCPLQEPKPFVGEIKVESQLLLANFFRSIEDTPQGKEYGEEYSLETMAGRIERAKYKASHNVAYGQMGNTTVGIYINEAKDSIIVGRWHDEDDRYAGYVQVGDISLDVWRWEATDLNTVVKSGVTLEALEEDHKYRGLIVLDVPHGVWKFTHNYDIIRRLDNEAEFDGIYAKLELKK